MAITLHLKRLKRVKNLLTKYENKMKNVVNRAFLAKKKCIFVSLMVLSLVACMGLTSCKAWRTITTTQTYVTQDGDKSSTVTFTTKQVEDYQGKKK